MPVPKDRVTICFRLSKKLHTALRSFVFQKERLYQDVIAEAIEKYLEDEGKKV